MKFALATLFAALLAAVCVFALPQPLPQSTTPSAGSTSLDLDPSGPVASASGSATATSADAGPTPSPAVGSRQGSDLGATTMAASLDSPNPNVKSTASSAAVPPTDMAMDDTIATRTKGTKNDTE